jgi:predicted chitinase
MATQQEKDERYQIIKNQLAVSGLSRKQQALLLGQVKKETGNYSSLTERYNGNRNEYFEKKYGFNTNKGRELGNTNEGDGERYRGRGYIQITGKANYAKYNDALYPEEANLPIDQKTLVRNPDLLLDPELGGKASLAYINDRAGNFESADDLTRAINGGLFNAARSRDPLVKQKALADINSRRQYGAEYINELEKYQESTDKYALPLLEKPKTTDKEAVKEVQKKIGAVPDGDWGKRSQTALEIYNRQAYDNATRPVDETYRQEGMQYAQPVQEPSGFENPFLAAKNWWNSL